MDGAVGVNTWENGSDWAIYLPTAMHTSKEHTSRPLRTVYLRCLSRRVGRAVFPHALEGSGIFLCALTKITMRVVEGTGGVAALYGRRKFPFKCI